MKESKIDEINVGKRLDEYLTILGVASSRNKCQSLIKDGKVFVNGKNEKPSFILRLDDIVTYEEYKEKEVSALKGEDIPIDIVYEDDDIIVVNKQAGLVVHPGNGNEEGTLVNALIYKNAQLAKSSTVSRPGIVHRIDKDTSGLLVVAKNEKAFDFISAQLADHSMHREYYALVKGIIYEDEGKIIAPIGRDPIHSTKNKVDIKKGKESITYFSVIKRFKVDDATLVSCRLLTGRTHQIRVHMEYIKHPVIGDLVYGSGNRKIYDKGQLLHAYKLTLIHPKTKKEVSFEAPLPKYFQDIIDNLK